MNGDHRFDVDVVNADVKFDVDVGVGHRLRIDFKVEVDVEVGRCLDVKVDIDVHVNVVEKAEKNIIFLSSSTGESKFQIRIWAI